MVFISVRAVCVLFRRGPWTSCRKRKVFQDPWTGERYKRTAVTGPRSQVRDCFADTSHGLGQTQPNSAAGVLLSVIIWLHKEFIVYKSFNTTLFYIFSVCSSCTTENFRRANLNYISAYSIPSVYSLKWKITTHFHLFWCRFNRFYFTILFVTHIYTIWLFVFTLA